MYVCAYDILKDSLKVVRHRLPKISMFCALFQNNQHLKKKTNKQINKLKNGIEV